VYGRRHGHGHHHRAHLTSLAELASTRRVITSHDLNGHDAALPHPFVGLSPRLVIDALARWVGQGALHPRSLAVPLAGLLKESAQIALGRSNRTPDPSDRRFTHEAWHSAWYRRLMQQYLALCAATNATVARMELDAQSAERARFSLSLFTESVAPTNSLITNPAALERAVQTRGRSLLQGVVHLADDVVRNGANPAVGDRRAHHVGETLAMTPGGVVMRTDVCELLQYQSTTARVSQTPVLIVPSPVNKFYLLDLSPGRSLVEYAVDHGLQVFSMSWRNVSSNERDWSLETYAQAMLDALRTTADIAQSPVHTLNVCAAGSIASAVLAVLPALGEEELVDTATFVVSARDNSFPTTLGSFATTRAAEFAVRRSRRRGTVPASQISRAFAWMRPREQFWTPVVNHYLLGLDLPVSDMSAWTMDATNLPAALHADFAGIVTKNLLVTPSGVSLWGHPVDLAAVENEVYELGAQGDHVVPWQACHISARHFSSPVTFVVASGGHVQSLINPPGHPRSRYWTGGSVRGNPDKWFANADEHIGTWWDHWLTWLASRTGPMRDAPAALGNFANPPIGPAPGEYVRHQA
jgi:polyhydroxyalkanoate synthase